MNFAKNNKQNTPILPNLIIYLPTVNPSNRNPLREADRTKLTRASASTVYIIEFSYVNPNAS
jgi:hypothetical protein